MTVVKNSFVLLAVNNRGEMFMIKKTGSQFSTEIVLIRLKSINIRVCECVCERACAHFNLIMFLSLMYSRLIYQINMN